MKRQIHESDSDAAALCSDHVRRFDPDRYLCAMFTPASARSAIMSVYAFNTELALVRERVNEPILGEMRFQWWRDQIEDAYERKARPEGIAGSIYDFIDHYEAPRRHFDDLINKRTRDLSDDPFNDLDGFVSYCSGTTIPLIQLSLIPLSRLNENKTIPEALAQNIGIAWAITGMIRSLPAQASSGRCLLPHSLLQNHGLTQETIYSNQSREQLRNVVRGLVGLADSHLAMAKVQIKSENEGLFSGFLPVVMTDFYLCAIRKFGFDPFHSRIQQPNSATRALRMMYASWRKKC